MLRRLKCDQWIVQAIGLPVSLSGSPIVGVAGKSKDNVVVTDVLRALIMISAAGSGGSDQS